MEPERDMIPFFNPTPNRYRLGWDGSGGVILAPPLPVPPFFFIFQNGNGMARYLGNKRTKSAKRSSIRRKRPAPSRRRGYTSGQLAAAAALARARTRFSRAAPAVRNARRSLQSHLAAARRHPGTTVYTRRGRGGRGVSFGREFPSVEAVHTVHSPSTGVVQVIAEDGGRVVSAKQRPFDRVPILGPLLRSAERVSGIWEDITHLFG